MSRDPRPTTAPVVPTIELVAHRLYKYFWLKYVYGVALDNHCARCLKGPFSRHLWGGSRTAQGTLDEYRPPRAYYLCGVTTEGWSTNLHLAFRAAPGREVVRDDADIRVRITDAEIIPIAADWIDWGHPRAPESAYNTCRNWWFAHWVASGCAPGELPPRQRPADPVHAAGAGRHLQLTQSRLLL